MNKSINAVTIRCNIYIVFVWPSDEFLKFERNLFNTFCV